MGESWKSYYSDYIFLITDQQEIRFVNPYLLILFSRRLTTIATWYQLLRALFPIRKTDVIFNIRCNRDDRPLPQFVVLSREMEIIIRLSGPSRIAPYRTCNITRENTFVSIINLNTAKRHSAIVEFDRKSLACVILLVLCAYRIPCTIYRCILYVTNLIISAIFQHNHYFAVTSGFKSMRSPW